MSHTYTLPPHTITLTLTHYPHTQIPSHSHHSHNYPHTHTLPTHTHDVGTYLAGFEDWTSCVTWSTNNSDTPSAKSKASGNFETSSWPLYLAQFLQKRGNILYNCFSFSTGFSISRYWLYTYVHVGNKFQWSYAFFNKEIMESQDLMTEVNQCFGWLFNRVQYDVTLIHMYQQAQ